MSKKRNKNIPNVKKSKSRQVPLIAPQSNENTGRMYFIFLYPNWLKAFKHDDFTTFLKDETMYADNMTYLFNTLIPKISIEWQKNRSTNEFRHCHKIDGGRSLGKYNRALKNIHPKISLESLELWQFGFNGNSIRLICHKEAGSNNLIPLLVDQHHLGSDSKHYNEPDYSTYDFCPIDKYIN
jgi:uncharacterized protein UU032